MVHIFPDKSAITKRCDAPIRYHNLLLNVNPKKGNTSKVYDEMSREFLCKNDNFVAEVLILKTLSGAKQTKKKTALKKISSLYK